MSLPVALECISLQTPVSSAGQYAGVRFLGFFAAAKRGNEAHWPAISVARVGIHAADSLREVLVKAQPAIASHPTGPMMLRATGGGATIILGPAGSPR